MIANRGSCRAVGQAATAFAAQTSAQARGLIALDGETHATSRVGVTLRHDCDRHGAPRRPHTETQESAAPDGAASTGAVLLVASCETVANQKRREVAGRWSKRKSGGSRRFWDARKWATAQVRGPSRRAAADYSSGAGACSRIGSRLAILPSLLSAHRRTVSLAAAVLVAISKEVRPPGRLPSLRREPPVSDSCGSRAAAPTSRSFY